MGVGADGALEQMPEMEPMAPDHPVMLAVAPTGELGLPGRPLGSEWARKLPDHAIFGRLLRQPPPLQPGRYPVAPTLAESPAKPDPVEEPRVIIVLVRPN